MELKENLGIKLYHGTSTLFLDSILKKGLAGTNPIDDWKVLNLGLEIYTLCEKHLYGDNSFLNKKATFKEMIDQSNKGSFNFQHGQTYITPSKQTAIRYAINNEYGSEFLSRVIFFLKKLLELEINLVTNDLYKKYPKIYGLLEARPSPVLIEINDVRKSDLLNEHGSEPESNFNLLEEYKSETSIMFDLLTQQINFRLINSVAPKELKSWMINVVKWHSVMPEFNLYEINKVN